MKLKSCLFPAVLLLTLAWFPSAGHQAAAAGRGTNAYVRGGTEIRLIEPDGSNDRRIWIHPRPDTAAEMGITGLAWRPDGGEMRLLVRNGSVPSWGR